MILDLFRNPGDPDPQPPAVGDVVLSAKLARVVTEVRPVESRVWHHRWRIELAKIGSGRRSDPAVVAEVESLAEAGADVRPVFSYGHGEGPVDHARAQGYEVDAG